MKNKGILISSINPKEEEIKEIEKVLPFKRHDKVLVLSANKEGVIISYNFKIKSFFKDLFLVEPDETEYVVDIGERIVRAKANDLTKDLKRKVVERKFLTGKELLRYLMLNNIGSYEEACIFLKNSNFLFSKEEVENFFLESKIDTITKTSVKKKIKRKAKFEDEDMFKEIVKLTLNGLPAPKEEFENFISVPGFKTIVKKDVPFKAVEFEIGNRVFKGRKEYEIIAKKEDMLFIRSLDKKNIIPVWEQEVIKVDV
jgi:hypothetical protein